MFRVLQGPQPPPFPPKSMCEFCRQLFFCVCDNRHEKRWISILMSMKEFDFAKSFLRQLQGSQGLILVLDPLDINNEVVPQRLCTLTSLTKQTENRKKQMLWLAHLKQVIWLLMKGCDACSTCLFPHKVASCHQSYSQVPLPNT